MKSSKSYLRYVDLEFIPDPDRYLVGKYHVVKERMSTLDGLAFLGAIAAESSTGTWIEVATDSLSNVNTSGTVYSYNAESKVALIAYPLALFEPGNVSQLLTVFAGNAFGLADLSELKLLDIHIPSSYMQEFLGPKFGVSGIYELLGAAKKSPIIGSIIKPKCGLDVKTFSNICFDAWVGMSQESGIDGVDMVKDDEALTSQRAFGSDFYDRFTGVMEKLKKAEDLTGKRKIYIPNITHSDQMESLKRAEFVQKNGGKAIMIDYVMSGCSLLNTVRNQKFDLIIHGHRTLFAALQRPKTFGISYIVWAKLFRMIGGDQVHTGTPSLGVMSAEESQVKSICKAITDMTSTMEGLVMDWSGHGRGGCLPVCGAGLDLMTMQPLVKSLGSTVSVFAGGGTHGHPLGTRAGSACLRASERAVVLSESVVDYSKKLNLDWRRYFCWRSVVVSGVSLQNWKVRVNLCSKSSRSYLFIMACFGWLVGRERRLA